MRPMHAMAFWAAVVLSLPAELAPAGWARAGAGGSPLVYSQPVEPSAVVLVQDRLRQQGFYQGRADGIWGAESQAALERFQQSRGLQASGSLNQATLATLGLNTQEFLAPPSGRGAGAPATGDMAAATPLAPTAVRNVQSRLRDLGFYRGEVDGVWGPTTQAAIGQFQQGRGLQANGQLNPVTLQAMGLDANNPAAPARR
jgi:peptidoglycan hydrolase-like protein with peptidoglycan-binding domain